MNKRNKEYKIEDTIKLLNENMEWIKNEFNRYHKYEMEELKKLKKEINIK